MSSLMSQYGAKGAVAALSILACVYHDRAIFDDKRADIKTQAGWPLVGNLPIVLEYLTRFHEFLQEAFTRLDSQTLTLSALGIPRHVGTIDPRNVEHILKHNFETYIKGPEFHSGMLDLFGGGIFNANGEEWKYQRKTASIIFNVKNFRDQFTDVFVKELGVMQEKIWDVAAKEHQVIDFQDIMFRFTLDSFIYLGFGVDLHALTTKGKVPFATSFDEAQKTTFLRFINPIWSITEFFIDGLTPWKLSTKQHLRVVDSFARDVIKKRRAEIEAGETRHTDLLSRFMDARNHRGDLLNDDELRDIVLNFIIAGRDTTAQALSWTFYLLMSHPRVEKKLLQEIHEHIEDQDFDDSPTLYEKIKNMTYAHAVFYEVLRHYPSVPLNQKYALEDDVWPDGTHIKKGDYILWAPFVQGRSEKVWGPDAKEFKPERWITAEGELRRESQGQWPAFHAGPRVCLGQHLATLEALIAIVSLMRRYKFSLMAGQEITYQVSLTLPMKYGMKVMVQRR